MQLKAHGATDVGRKRRHNEDAFLVDAELGLFVVADGLGGHASGEIASNEAIDTIHGWVRREKHTLEKLRESPGDSEAIDEARRTIERAIMGATYHVFSMSEIDQRNAGMGTTVSALIVAGEVGVIAQVGDSRIYRVRNGTASQLTDDHTLIAMQIRDGLITPEEARTAPHRNVITRAVGSHEYVQVDTTAVAVSPGDAYLLCTDGLHGYVARSEVSDLLRHPPHVATARLIDLALERGGKDNITAVVVRVEP
jgi:protein phosphatase